MSVVHSLLLPLLFSPVPLASEVKKRAVTAFSSPSQSKPRRQSRAMNSPFRSAIRDPEHPQSPLRPALEEPSPPPPPHNTPLNPTAAALPAAASVASYSAWGGSAAPTVKAEDGLGAKDRGMRPVRGYLWWEKRAAAARQAVLGVRVAAAVLCLISFSVMAANRKKGWAEDSYDQYKEYRYCITVNVLGFLYAGFQAYAEIHHMIKGKYIIRHQVGYYFDFSVDQILAYLLISASSAATTRTDEWVENWGTDPFPSMARCSAAISFLAFVVFALSSLISAYRLFSQSI